MRELRKYFDKSPPFHLATVWESAKYQSGAAWWDTCGGNLETAQKHLYLIHNAIPNQTACERDIKAVKQVNSKDRARALMPNVSDFEENDECCVTNGLKAALVKRRLCLEAWEDPTKTMTFEDKKYSITELDEMTWADLFDKSPDNHNELDGPQRNVLFHVEEWEQPPRMSNETRGRLKIKYLGLYITDDDDINPNKKIVDAVWEKGRGNSYRLVAVEVSEDDVIDHNTRKTYRTSDVLLEMIEAACEAGRNKGIKLIRKITSDLNFEDSAQHNASLSSNHYETAEAVATTVNHTNLFKHCLSICCVISHLFEGASRLSWSNLQFYKNL